MYSVDFETEAIVKTSNKPPKPVGLSIRSPDGINRYYAFGHPTENNCTEEEARQALLDIWDEEMVGQNILAFDLWVAEYWWKLPKRDPLLTHDTMIMAYLLDPHSPSLSLKWLAENWLGMPPDDQTALHDWILANVPECRTKKQAGAHISKAPGGLVGNYAEMDTEMAFRLYEYCWPKMQEMLAPYDRERVLAPILMDMKQKGIRIDLPRLKEDYHASVTKLHNLDALIRERLNCPNLNPGSDAELVRALQAAGFRGFLLTPTGKLSANEESLEGVLAQDPDLQKMLHSRATYDTLVGTFMRPWITIAEANGGTINPTYNAIRNEDGFGTRTGRLSSSDPNGQNIPGDQGTDYFGDAFPQMRSYCLPDDGCVWYSIDFKSQEPRLTAHFKDGALMQEYVADPDLDPYIFVKEAAGGDTTRKDAKVIFLGLIYAMGAQTLADKLGCAVERASSLRTIIKGAIPDVVQLDKDCKRRFRLGLPIKTLGGRICFCEPPKNGRTWEYKALNLLIQGSAADQTKEAMIYADEASQIIPYFRMFGSVHDEVNLCAPPGNEKLIHEMMTMAANALPCDVPMRITMGVGSNWAEAAKE